MDKLKSLLSSKKITEFEYQSYLIFCINDLGRSFLQNVTKMFFEEEPPSLKSEASFAWKDGRMSAWRDITQAVKLVQSLLDGEENE
jgi:hypothetical protein